MRIINVLMNVAIYILLLLLGISVGSNPVIMLNIGSIGLKAMAIAFAAIAGSVATGWLFQRLFFTERMNEE